MKTRFIRAAAALLLAAVFCASFASADGTAAARRTVRVGFFPFDGYHMVSSDGSRSGYGYDYLQRMLPFAGWKLDYVGYEDNKSWSDMLDMLENGEIDLLTSAVKTPEREARFAFSDRSIGTSSTILTVEAGDERYLDGNYGSWDGMRVGLLNGNSRNDSLASFAREKGFSYVPVYFDSTGELTSALSAGDIDAIATSNLRKVRSEWIIAQFDSKPFYIMVRKDDAQLLAEVNDALEQLQNVSPDLSYQLYQEYYAPESGDEIAFTAAERAFIADCKARGTVFKAIMNPDREPYSYLENGKMTGILTDICAEIFRRTGLTVEMVPCADRQEYLKLQNDPDMSLCCDLSGDYSAAEKLGYVLTAPYYDTSIARINLKSQTGDVEKIGMMRGGVVERAMFGSLEGEQMAVWFDSVDDCVAAVKNGDVDAAYLLSRTAQQAVLADVKNQLSYVTLPRQSVEFAVGVGTDENCLLSSILEKAARSVTDADTAQLAQPYTVNTVADTTLTGVFYDHPIYAVSLVGGVLALAFLSVLAVVLHRKQVQEKRANAALKTAKEEADRASRAKTEFISRISHDIRTPMNAISGMTEFALQDREAPEKLTDDLEKIRSSGAFLSSLINDVLDISKIDSGKIELHPEPYPQEEYRRNLENMFAPLCLQRGLEFSAESTGDDGTVLADHIRLNQISLNLVSNAIKYTPPGGRVTCRMEGKKRPDGQFDCVFAVEDTGIGMSEEFQKVMFEPFSQDMDNPARQQMEHGTGLGLSIVQRIVELMGGSVTVRSAPGKGTLVTVLLTLPAAGEQELRDYLAERRGAPESMEKLRGTVLLAEDNDINAEIASRLLADMGLSVVRAENGRRAVELFRQSEPGTYSVVLMDIQMPEMNGYDAARAIRALFRTDAAVPIFALTADAFDEAVERARQAGMNGHITKPLDPRTLREALEKALGRPASAPDAPAR